MAHLIDKDPLVAEIERRMQCYSDNGCEPNGGKWVELISIKHFLDTLEVKEVQESASEDLEQAAREYFLKTYGIDNIAISEDIKRAVKFGAQWQKEQDFNDFARLRKSWYKEGKIDGKFEGLSDDEKYQQGFHDAKEQMMKGAIEGRLSSTVTGSEQYVSAYVGYGEYGKDGDKVKVIIIKE